VRGITELTPEQFFRDKLRSARGEAFRDAGNFEGIVIALEMLAAAKLGKVVNGFGDCRDKVLDEAVAFPKVPGRFSYAIRNIPSRCSGY